MRADHVKKTNVIYNAKKASSTNSAHYVKNRKASALALVCTGTLLLAGCSSAAGNTTEEGSGSSDAATVQASLVSADEMFTTRDMEAGYDEEKCVKIELNGDTATADSDAVAVNGSTVTIQSEGTYLLSGTLDDGMIVVDVADSEKVQLVLDQVSITNADSAAIYVLEADKVFLTTTEGSVNTLINGGDYAAIDENNIDAVIFSKEDLTLNGSGTLVIQAEAGHGIVSKDDLVLTGGTYEITAASHGLSGKDSVRIADGTYMIESGKDGIHVENADDESLGFVYLAGGTFGITSEGDGISASSYMQIEDGEYKITTGGGVGDVPASEEDVRRMGGRPDMWGQSETTEETVSTKGIKAATELMVNGGVFDINAEDDAIHSNGNIMINGGSYEISTGDDGMHADAALTIQDGTIHIAQSYEGLEGLSIDISGGEIDLTASDDGLNAAGGTDHGGAPGRDAGGRGQRGDMFAATEGAYIKITGGMLHVNASGDGIDSNGALYMEGGTVFVSGPTNSANGTLDYTTEAVISGGVFVGAGANGMAENFGSGSTQGTMMVTVDAGQAGSEIILSDADGNELVSWTADKAYNSVIVSCPEIQEGENYTLSTGDAERTVTMSSLVYSEGGMGGMKGL